jgi:Tfp pilus assembly protein PilO
MKKQPNPKVFLALAALSLTGGATAVAFQYLALTETTENVAKLKKDALDEKDLAANLAKSVEQLKTTSAKLNHLEKGVPETAYVPTLLTELEKFGKSRNIEVLGVRPLETPKGKPGSEKEKAAAKPYNELAIEIKGRGTYGNAMRFVQSMRSFPKIVAVRTVTLSPKTGNEAASLGTLEITLELRAYVFPLPTVDEASAEGSAPAPPAEEGTKA